MAGDCRAFWRHAAQRNVRNIHGSGAGCRADRAATVPELLKSPFTLDVGRRSEEQLIADAKQRLGRAYLFSRQPPA